MLQNHFIAFTGDGGVTSITWAGSDEHNSRVWRLDNNPLKNNSCKSNGFFFLILVTTSYVSLHFVVLLALDIYPVLPKPPPAFSPGQLSFVPIAEQISPCVGPVPISEAPIDSLVCHNFAELHPSAENNFQL